MSLPMSRLAIMKEEIRQFQPQSLRGQVIVVTRMQDQAKALSEPLVEAGAEVIEAPTIAIGEMENYEDVDEALQNIANYDWLVLTSANGVEAMINRLEVIGQDKGSLNKVKIAAIGSATAACLTSHNLTPDLIPAEAVSESMAEELIELGASGQRVLLLRADIARRQLPEALRRAGFHCDDPAIYKTGCAKELPKLFLEKLDAGKIDWITLMSPSSFVNLLTLLGKDKSSRLNFIKLASIGPVTTRAIREAGFLEKVEAQPHDVRGLIMAIIQETSKSQNVEMSE